MAKVTVNPPKTPVTKGSHGTAAATIPNVCKMPGPPAPFVPTPLPNIGTSDDSPEGYSITVRIEGEPVAIKGSTFKSKGDIASQGTGGGLVSSNVQGPTKFIAPGSMDVKIEGKNVQLLGDQMLNNCGPSGNPANAATMMGTMQDAGSLSDACPKCGGSHPGFEPGKPVPDDTALRRGLPKDKLKDDGSISKSAFKDAELSVDVASARTAAETLSAPHLAGGKSVEFTAAEAKDAFPGNEVIFDCIPENPHHCIVKGKKTDGQCNKFAAKLAPRLA
jgi:uncharacterized Zn-binding protein involved in type VI secretion